MAVVAAVPATRRVNHHVDNMCYAADVGTDGICTVDIPAVAASSATALANAVAIAAAGNVAPTVVQTEFIMGRYGRNITISGGTGSGTLVGYDYLGQPIRETFALGAGPVVGKKMFKDVSHLIVPAAATISIGTGLILGVPYKILSSGILGELTSDVTPTAGAILPGVVAQTLTSGDPRGAYTPNQPPDGVKWYRFTCIVDRSNLHGAAHALV
jgi:hypothetical protein